MAKGGFPGGFGGGFGGGGMQGMMKKVQKMQAAIVKLEEEMKQKTVEATAGGGAVRATVSGDNKLVAVKIDPAAVDAEDMEMLEDMIVTAVNDGFKQIEAMKEEEMNKVTGGIKMPGM